MLCQPEDPNALRIDENILELHHGQVRRKQPQGKTKKVDPLHELFVSSDPNEIGVFPTNISCIPIMYTI